MSYSKVQLDEPRTYTFPARAVRRALLAPIFAKIAAIDNWASVALTSRGDICVSVDRANREFTHEHTYIFDADGRATEIVSHACPPMQYYYSWKAIRPGISPQRMRAFRRLLRDAWAHAPNAFRA